MELKIYAEKIFGYRPFGIGETVEQTRISRVRILDEIRRLFIDQPINDVVVAFYREELRIEAGEEFHKNRKLRHRGCYVVVVPDDRDNFNDEIIVQKLRSIIDGVEVIFHPPVRVYKRR